MATNLRGVMAALLTPFDQQQALDKASLRRLVQFNIQQGPALTVIQHFLQ